MYPCSFAGHCELHAAWAHYAATDAACQAASAWHAALHQARQEQNKLLRLVYLRALGSFYQQRG